jgi:hypothetical protein
MALVVQGFVIKKRTGYSVLAIMVFITPTITSKTVRRGLDDSAKA